MAKTWFKFYGQEFLTDPKMLSLSALERSLWLTMLCLASASDEQGVIKYIDETKIKIMTNLTPLDDEWEMIDGFLEKFAELGMIEIDGKRIILNNFEKRQETNLTNAERQERHRAKVTKEKKPRVTKVTEEKNNDVTEVTLDKIREDKKREEKIVNVNDEKSLLRKLPNLNKDPEQVDYITDELVEFLHDEKSRDYIHLASWKIPDAELHKWISELKEPGIKNKAKLFTSKAEKFALGRQL